MLWRARITMPDRPGALASLATACGSAGVNILGMQVFPGLDGVTDELVLSVPDAWIARDIADLMRQAGAEPVSANRCGEGALVDQPTRFVQASRTVVAQPARFPEVVAALFDAEPDPDKLGEGMDHMELVVGDVQMLIHRRAPFTATERARGAAMAELVNDVITDRRAQWSSLTPGRRLGGSVAPSYVRTSHAVQAVVDGTVVARAVLAEMTEPGVRRLALEVDPAWRRRGIGSRLMIEASRLAAGLGDDELLFLTTADNQAVLPMVLGSGLRGRIRLAGDALSVRVPLRDLTPVRA